MLKKTFKAFPIAGLCLLSAVLFFFRVPFSNLLSSVIVRPLFASFEQSFWADSFLVLVLLILTVWMAREQDWKLLLRFALFSFVFYSFQRANPYWNFIPTFLFPELAYWDLVAVALALLLPLYFVFQQRLGDADLQHVTVGFVEDNSVKEYADDHFNRRVAAAEIARLIQLTNNKKSFAIGILGEYGSGKTSFLNLINLSLKDVYVLKISFNPWSAGNSDTIRREFFDLLASSVASIDLRISSLIYSYGRKMATFDTRSLSWLNWLSFFRNSGPVRSLDEYQQINDMLSSTGRKIVVTIDDLDRLYPSEIMEVLKLIRNTADFSSVFYLVGYDKRYVQNAIGTLSETEGLDYLDKIFQLEIPLPKREEDDLVNILQQRLKEILSDAHYEVLENEMIPNGFSNVYGRAYGAILRHGRDVVRFLNGFKVVYSLIGAEVDFKCLMLLELIKFRFPIVYDLIYSQSNQFLYENSVRSTHEQYFLPRMVKEQESKNASVEVSVFKKYIENSRGLSSMDVSLLDELFLLLFDGSSYHSPEAKNSISYPLYFEIYFRYRLSHRDLSDKDYRAAIASSRVPDYMRHCATRGLHKELMVRLMQEDISKERFYFEQVISWIFSFGRTFVEKEGLFRFDYEALIGKIYNYHNVISEKLYRKDKVAYRNFISNLFNVASAPYLFENELIYHLKKRGDQFVIPTSELTAHQLSYFTRMAESNHGLNEDSLWLFWGAREDYRVPADEKGSYYMRWRFEPQLVSRMKAYLLDLDPKELLKFSIERNPRDTSQATISKHVLEMFEDVSEYRKLIDENRALNEEIKKEYLELFDKCCKTDFKTFVEMDFKSELQKT